MRAAVIAFSENGYTLGERLMSFFSGNGYSTVLTRCEHGTLKAWTREHFEDDALIFIGSCAIAVRAISPFLTDKTRDPAVIVIDELALHVIALLSGHIGGANQLAVTLANFLDSTPVITTATDINGVFSVDSWAVKNCLQIANPDRIKPVSSRLLAGESVNVKCDFPISGRLFDGLRLCEKGGHLIITYRTRGPKESLRLIAPVVTLGIGCKKGITADDIESAFLQTLKKADCHPLAVARVCSIDLKADEPGILEFCRRHRLPYQTFSAQELMALPGIYTSSAFVKQITGVDNICERSAVLGSGEGGRLLSGRQSGNGITMALALSPHTICFDEEERL